MKKQLLVITLALLSNAVFADDLIDSLILSYGKDNTAVLDLAGQQVVCGYSDVNSDINSEQYADKVCQHFGYAASVGHRCGTSVNQDESQAKILTVAPATGNPIEVPFVKEPGRSLGFYSLMICVKQIPNEADAFQRALAYRDFALCTHGREYGSINDRKKKLATAVQILESLSKEASWKLAYEAKKELAVLRQIASKLLGNGTDSWDVGTTCPAQ